MRLNVRLVRGCQTCENEAMHTHFASATHATAAFLSVVIVGTVWRLTALHGLALGTKRNLRHVSGLARAALFQY